MDGSFYSDAEIWPEAECHSAQRLFETRYDDLLLLARRIRRRRLASDTYLTGDLLHDAFLKMQREQHWRDEEHFLASMALALRHALIGHARNRKAAKRGGGQVGVSIDEVDVADDTDDGHLDRILDVKACLSDLAKESPRLVRVIDCRFFAGYTEDETASLLGVTSRTVRRDWEKARAYLKMRLDFSQP
ncbi:hypothetical protein HY29_16995 [Hyphomonas beringensis]|uniref:RNA polymerase sigma-70 ECF-like HTH domain-containing protein n=1 Tax=Hyphomonas beringensis TaxID=1280946 RepID=A0A062TZT5_9PROT|nr:ECF-type sigma factor [Hyphomonas beringensis]KCZ53566.1 hypothetical protein HY29_16995 [Hyphomonas beringensis]